MARHDASFTVHGEYGAETRYTFIRNVRWRLTLLIYESIIMGAVIVPGCRSHPRAAAMDPLSKGYKIPWPHPSTECKPSSADCTDQNGGAWTYCLFIFRHLFTTYQIGRCAVEIPVGSGSSPPSDPNPGPKWRSLFNPLLFNINGWGPANLAQPHRFFSLTWVYAFLP